MKYSIFSILFIVSLCEANEFVCQLFNTKTKSLEKYCANFKQRVPKHCEREIDAVEVFQVEKLKLGGCDDVTVSDCIERFKNLRILDISNSGYKSLDWLDLNIERLEKLDASHNELSSIKIFQQNALELTEINLSHNEFKRIEAGVFSGVSKLVKIHLSYNAINSIDAEAFVNSTNLEYIDLSNNRFWSIPIFAHNKQLKEIHLENNPILTFSCSDVSKMSTASLYFDWDSTISYHGDGDCEQKPMHVVRDYSHEGVFVTTEKTHEIHCNEQSFVNLTIFMAGHNSLVNGVDFLQCFGPSVMHLDLSENFIGKLNFVVFERFDHLTALCLSNTMLMDFDFNMLKSKTLMKLDISHNNLKHLNNFQMLENLNVLEEFYIDENQLSNAAELIQHLNRSIQKLDLSGNFLGILNATTFERLTSLKLLAMRNTMLSMLDFSPFEPLKNLSFLDISQNDLKRVNFTMLSMFNQLNTLNAAYCQIEHLSGVTQHLGPSITELDLSGNKVGVVNFGTFDTLTNLRRLNLSNANIQNFNFNALQHQKNLRLLDISYNKLQEVNLDGLSSKRFSHFFMEGNDVNKLDNFHQSHFPELGTVAISKNQLPCDHLKQIIIEWEDLTFVGDPFDQKHDKNCLSTIQTISDFFNSSYNRVKFW